MNRIDSRKPPALYGAAFAAAFFFTACSDPANNVHKTTVADPQKAASSQTVAAKKHVIRAESKVGFVGSKVTGSHDGGFKNFEGFINVADGKLVAPSEIKIDMKSTWSDNDRLTGHLKSPDFFDAEKFPTSTFSVTSIEPAGPQQKITGNLTLHGVTKSISFPADVAITDEAVTLKADFAINRRDFNINYPGKPNDLIRDNVVMKLDIKATPGAPRPEDQISTTATAQAR